MLKVVLRFLLPCGLLTLSIAALAAPHKVRVADPAVARSLVAQGGRLLADYDTFQVIEADDTLLAGTGTDGEKVQPADRFNVIELNAHPLDTSRPEVQALRSPQPASVGRRLRLVQFVGPVKPEWRAALEANGGHIIAYVPQNAYLVYGDAAVLGRLRAWAQAEPGVQWDGDYADEHKIHPRARPMDAAGNPQRPATDLFVVQLVDDVEANAETLTLIGRLALEPVRREFRALQYLNLIVRLPPGQLDLIASQPEVISIQPYVENQKLDERQGQILAGNLSGNSPAGPGYLSWLAGKGFTQAQFDASGFVVDISDSGLDNGTTAPGHFALYTSGDPGQAARVAYVRLEGTPHGGSTLQGCDGHGNLNAHLIAGYSDGFSGIPHADSSNYLYGLGICPFVKIGSSVIFDPALFTSPNYADLQSDAYHDGARISANSWGSDVDGVYNADSQAYDALVRDAQPAGSTFEAAGNQEMVIVFAAGNAGPDASTINSPGSGKNVITVGASENVRSLSTANGGNDPSGNSRCVNDSDLAADSADDLPDFSSRGPCTDGRMKPDLVAPGTHITGGVAQAGAPTTNGTGSAINCFDASGVCGLPGAGWPGNPNNFFPLGQQFYTVSTGTSHSTPAVAGACALLRQYFTNLGLTPPSPAMTKAFLVNSARYLSGAGANDTLWSAGQGMGEVNLGNAFDAVPRVLSDQHVTNKFTSTGQTRRFTGSIADAGKPFRVTLAWTDAPGSTVGNAFNNDLDLTVTVGGNTYKGNVFSGAFSTTGGTADYRNNVESVLLPAGLAATFSVTVSAANIVSDGVPNDAPSLDQDFALVIYNAVEGPVPVVAADAYELASESCASTNGAVDPGEAVTVEFALKNTGSADTTNLVATLLETNGVAAPGGSQNYGALIAGGGAVTQSFSFTAVGTCGGTIQPVLELYDGTTALGTVTLTIPLGQNATIFSQNFDGVTAPALPGGWTTASSGAQSAWTTQSAVRDTLPNAAFSAEAASVGINQLVSPALSLPSGETQLTFRSYYNLEAGSGSVGYDGGVLEIKIGAGAFTDILAAGGSFVSGGYNRTISSFFGSPLAGRQAWSGNSGGFITTLVNLPLAASGQTIQLRWRCGTDNSVSGAGWRVDTIALNGYVCCATGVAELDIAEWPVSGVVNLGGTFTNFLAVTNLGPGAASGVVITNVLPPGLTFVLAVPSQGVCTNYGAVVTCALGTLSNGAAATLEIHSLATTAGTWTNIANVSSATLDPLLSNNTVIASILVNSPPIISGISAQGTSEDEVLGPIGFTVGDEESPASALTLSAASSDDSLVNVTNIIFGGSESNRTVTLMPSTNQSGSCTITLTVSDGLASASNSFVLTVDAVNDPPILAPIVDLMITEEQLFSFTNSAFDVEAPPEALTFSLSNAPAGAAVNATNGVFTWMPAEDQGPGSNYITVIVTDDGVPPLSAAQSFALIVLESNRPPVLAAIKDRTVHAGSQVVETNSASDPDLPINVLTFLPGGGTPPGASVDPVTGLFTWTPDNSYIGTSNSITIEVMDDGMPPLSDSNSFVVTVVAPPLIESITRSNNVVTLTWSAINGQNYSVQYCEDLTGGVWNPLLPDVTASGSTASQQDVISSSARFYRIRVQP